MDITVNDTNLAYLTTGISIKKITISSISIDPLKRIANFTVSYWNGTIFLGQESYTYKATYTSEISPTLKSISVSSTTSYTITINATIGHTPPYTPLYFTSPFPYLTSGLTIYYSQIDPSIISFDLTSSTSYTSVSPKDNITNMYTYTGDFGTFTLSTNYTGSGTIPYLSITNASYSFVDTSNVDTSNIRVFYTVNDIQYNVKIASNLPCRAGITTLYKNSDNLLSVTTDPTNFNIPLSIATTDTLTVKSEPNTSVSNSPIQTNIYNTYDTTPIYKSVSALPTLTIYYNQNNISDISSTQTGNYTSSATAVSFTSVTFKVDSYQFSNLSYTATNKNGISVIVTFQSKQLSITSLAAIDPAKIGCNPLNTSDIGFLDDETNYKNLISIILSTPKPTTANATTQITSLINTLKNKTVSIDSTKGTLSIP